MRIWIAVASELALDNPKLSVFHSEYVGATIARSTDYTNIVKCILHEKASHISLESAP